MICSSFSTSISMNLSAMMSQHDKAKALYRTLALCHVCCTAACDSPLLFAFSGLSFDQAVMTVAT